MEDKLNAYLLELTDCELTEDESRDVTAILHLLSEFERIGDYTINVLECAQELFDKQLSFSEEAMVEFEIVTNAIDEIVEMAIVAVAHNDIKTAQNIEPLEEVVDQMEDTLKARHIQRFKTGQCVIECGVIFLDMLTNLERIADHCSNIGVYVIGKNIQREALNRHEYVQKLHKGESEQYKIASEMYLNKYRV
jgi:phosphate:Na+ symporter